MSGIGNLNDADFNESEAIASGSVGYDFDDIANESTASLGISGSISEYQSSINTVTANTDDSYEFSHVEKTIKFLKSKVYQNVDKIQGIMSRHMRIYGKKDFRSQVSFRNTITGSINGNAATANNADNASIATTASFATTSSMTTGNAGTATTLETTRTIGGVSFNGSANITPTSHMGSNSTIFIHPTQFRGGTYSARTQQAGLTTTSLKEDVSCACMIPIGKTLTRVTLFSSNGKTEGTVNNLLLSKGTTAALVFNNKGKQVTTINASQPWDLYTTILGGTYLQSTSINLILIVTLNSGDYFRGVTLNYA